MSAVERAKGRFTRKKLGEIPKRKGATPIFPERPIQDKKRGGFYKEKNHIGEDKKGGGPRSKTAPRAAGGEDPT